ncbi:hypothetical protein MASR2M8_03730 [Opitutaceae bacterium]
MTDLAKASIDGRQRILLSRWLTGGIIMLLGALFYMPVTGVMDVTLDNSNYASYSYFAANRFQYGPEVVPMSGPYGYVQYGSIHGGLLFWPRYWLQVTTSLAFAGLLVGFIRTFRLSAWTWVWLAFLWIFSRTIEDVSYEWMILLSGILLLRRQGEPGRRWAPALVALLAFLSLIKGTHLILAVATLGVVLLHHARNRDWRQIIRLGGVYTVAFIVLWILAGQDPLNIPSFLHGILSLAQGYNEAMALEESPAMLVRGLLAATVLMIALGWGLWHRRGQPAAIAATLLIAGVSFVKWKHGFVRADGHRYIFHYYAAAAAVFWYLLAFVRTAPPATEPANVRRIGLALMLLGIGTGFTTESPLLSLKQLQEATLSRGELGLRQLFQPSAAKLAFDTELARMQAVESLPRVRQEVGRNAIDFFGYRHGVLALNELNYRPRPMGGGSFNVYNRDLLERNRDFLRDPQRRPPFYLFSLETIDDRLATQDDGLALLELLHGYRPLLRERGYLLLSRVDDEPAPQPEPLARTKFRFGDEVTVPTAPPDRLVLARFTFAPTVAGRIRRFLYKAPLLTLAVKLDGQRAPELRRVVPSMTETPFLFSPFLDSNEDYIRLHAPGHDRTIRSFVITADGAPGYAANAEVEFFTFPRPTPLPRRVDEWLGKFDEGPVFGRPPADIEGDNLQPIQLETQWIQPLHAPGRVTWLLDGTETDLIFDYGIRPEAHGQGGNGVTFVVELQSGAEPTQIVWQRSIDTLIREEDRRILTARVPLPPVVPGTRLVLRTDPGAFGDNAWDWSYLARVLLIARASSLNPDQRVTRNLLAMEGSRPAIAELDGREVIMVHVPGAMTFGLEREDRRVSFDYGFLPGAYTGNGSTPGADFIVELERANEPKRELWRRTLRPREQASDRGRQSAWIDLPAAQPGDRLVLRTRPPANGNESWGWTYFSRIVID